MKLRCRIFGHIFDEWKAIPDVSIDKTDQIHFAVSVRHFFYDRCKKCGRIRA